MNPIPTAGERRSEQLRALTDLSRALTYTVDAEEVVKLAVTRAAELLEAENALLMLHDGDGVLRVRASKGISPDKIATFSHRLDESLIRRLQEAMDAPVEEGFLGVPLVASGAVIGLLAVVRHRGGSFTEDEEWLLSALGDQVAVAVEMARLEEEVGRHREAAAAEPSPSSRDDLEVGRDTALATLSHDLRSPLNAIDSYAELMEMELLGPIVDRQREALGRIRMSGRHLLAVLENVLEMTRIAAGVVRVRSGRVPISGVVDEAVLMISPSAIARDQTLDVEGAAAPVVAADPNRLRQALMNVLGNAVKYTPVGGTIRVRVGEMEREGRSWGTVTVADTGPGIAEEMLESIFQPYYRIRGNDDSTPEGTGLGLAISRELVRQMGGDIEVQSVPGRGATFIISLPAAG